MTSSKNAIILIHGIGDQEPKSTLDAFARSIAEETGTPRDRKQVVYTSRAPHARHDFTYFVDSMKIHGNEFVVAEMFWSKLSPVASGFMANIYNFFRLVANAPDIVYACLGPRAGEKKGPHLLRFLRAVLAFSFWVIYYPIVALNIAFAVFFLWFILYARLYARVIGECPDARACLETPAAAQFLLLSVLSALLSFYVFRHLTHKAKAEAAAPSSTYAALSRSEIAPSPTKKSAYRYPRAIAVHVTIIMVLIGVVSLASIFAQAAGIPAGLEVLGFPLRIDLLPVDFKHYAIMLGGALNWLWLVPIGIDLLFLAALPLIIPFFLSRWRGLLLGSATAYMITRFWLALLTSGWLTLLSYVLNDPKLFDAINRPLLVSTRGLSLVWLDLAALTIGAAIVYGIHLRRTSRRKHAHAEHSRSPDPLDPYPRLLVPITVLLLTIALSAVWLLAIYLCSCEPEQCKVGFCKAIDWSTLLIITYAGVLVGVGAVLLQISAGGFKIATDIVNYFRTDFGHRNPNPFEAIASAYNFANRGSSYRSLRDRLNDMLAKLHEDLERDHGPFERVVLIAHSLGTMIAIGALRECLFGEAPRARFELITMGSPYVNVFNHYFSHMFGPLDDEPLPGLTRWLNIYRENDYVGTHLGYRLDYMTESRHGAKGHFGYFSDAQVMKDIIRWFEEGGSVAAPPAAVAV